MDLSLFEKYIEDYGTSLYSFCRYMTSDVHDADDLYQQTLLTAFEKAEIDGSRNPKSYLITIAVNLWNNQKRKRMWRSRIAPEISIEDENTDQVADDRHSVEAEIIKSEEAENVRRLVNGLPEKLKIVIIMYYMEEMSINDIASALGIPTGTVKSRMNKAKKILKERLSDEG